MMKSVSALTFETLISTAFHPDKLFQHASLYPLDDIKNSRTKIFAKTTGTLHQRHTARSITVKMQYLECRSKHECETLPTSRMHTQLLARDPREKKPGLLYSHLQYPENSVEEFYQLDMGWKEWVSYPFAVFMRQKESNEQIRAQLVHEFLATVCEVWSGAGLSTKSFALQVLKSFRRWSCAMARWLEQRRRRMYRTKKKTE